jgi:hypothetical protein
MKKINAEYKNLNGCTGNEEIFSFFSGFLINIGISEI